MYVYILILNKRNYWLLLCFKRSLQKAYSLLLMLTYGTHLQSVHINKLDHYNSQIIRINKKNHRTVVIKINAQCYLVISAGHSSRLIYLQTICVYIFSQATSTFHGRQCALKGNIHIR